MYYYNACKVFTLVCQTGYAILMAACERGYVEIVTLLLAVGANANAADDVSHGCQ